MEKIERVGRNFRYPAALVMMGDRDVAYALTMRSRSLRPAMQKKKIVGMDERVRPQANAVR